MMIKELLSRLEPIKSERGFRIKYNGRFVKMSSGKHLWTSETAARLALRNEFLYDVRAEIMDWKNFTERKEQIFKRIFNEVEIVELHE